MTTSTPTPPDLDGVEAGRTLRRNWKGQFIKRLRETPPDSREWLIWSRYHQAWHRRSGDGGACGYTNDIAQAGVFIRSKANSYNDGDRNEAFHVSEKVKELRASLAIHDAAIVNIRFALEAGNRSALRALAIPATEQTYDRK